MAKQTRIFVAQLLGTMIVILGGPGSRSGCAEGWAHE